MKKQLLLSMIFTLFCGMIYGQHLIRVNNDPAADADYTTLQAANDAASDGDTIYVEGSTTNYGDAVTFDRQLTIIGTGYFLTENDSTQANGLEAYLTGTITFGALSEDSEITGIHFNSMNISVSYIKVTRCQGSSISIPQSSIVGNILISQNYLNGISASSYGVIMTNSIISNNIINGSIGASSGSGPLQVLNNVVTISIDVYNSNISNNITTSTTWGIGVNTGNTITYNISAAPGTNDAAGNKFNVAMTSVFVDYSGSLGYSNDAKWKLKAGSPALEAGVNGIDCGAFGGVSPYVLSGMPALPHIYEATIPGTASSDKGLSCTIKVKAGK